MRRALLSVTDKTGVVDFARGLKELGFHLMSTGGTRRALVEAGLEVEEVAEYTDFPEMMDGRVKTLHPKVHGGILAQRDNDDHVAAMTAHRIDPVDVVAVNLYAFRETAAREGVTPGEVIENIDIGGPSMVRSAAKNHAHVAILVDPSDYGSVLEDLRAHEGRMGPGTGERLAAKAFAHTAAYDTAIAQWFAARQHAEGDGPAPSENLTQVTRTKGLRYGENPHQTAAVYRTEADGVSLVGAEQLAGKELSYNNLLDLDAALSLVAEFEQPACVIVKHNNPCGTGQSNAIDAAFRAALASDPLSAFGGIHAYNRTLDVATAEAIKASETFVEAIVAPEVDADALAVLAKAKGGANLRVLAMGGMPDTAPRSSVRPISGGFLVQDADVAAPIPDLTVATERAPSDAELAALRFAWRVCKHVRSNAIVLACGDGTTSATVGVGAGQMSRVDSVEISVKKAGDRAQGAVLASDAFFPFADGLKAAAEAGVTAVIQPGGSKRDDEVIAAANTAGVAMVFTGRRHFRH